jgi:hypothetical protein
VTDSVISGNIGAAYSEAHPPQGFIWDGSRPTQFFRGGGAFTNGSNFHNSDQYRYLLAVPIDGPYAWLEDDGQQTTEAQGPLLLTPMTGSDNETAWDWSFSGESGTLTTDAAPGVIVGGATTLSPNGDTDPHLCDPPPSKYVFVTSTAYTGDLGGIAGADAICRAHAEAPAKPLPGEYKAWITGDNASAPYYRFTHSASPYVLVNGDPVADDWEDLVDGSSPIVIDRDENGTVIPQIDLERVWTNTTEAGLQAMPPGGPGVNDYCGQCDGPVCEPWTYGINAPDIEGISGIVGGVSDTDEWTWAQETKCHNTLRLYCFQQ